jgi:hypothetical protein
MSQRHIPPPDPDEAERRRRRAEDADDEQRDRDEVIDGTAERASLPFWHPAIQRLAREQRAGGWAGSDDRQAP